MSVSQFSHLVETLAARFDASRRSLVAIAGPPGAGKSTLADQLAPALNTKLKDAPAIVVPMDGFHYDDGLLEARGLRAKKGAPETFDADGFLALIKRLKHETGPIAIPVFDRALEISRGSARIVEPQHRLLVIEGNYLLLNRPVWRELKPLFDFTVFLRPDLATIEKRLVDRWLGYGFSPKVAREKAHGNDLANARIVLEESLKADLELRDPA